MTDIISVSGKDYTVGCTLKGDSKVTAMEQEVTTIGKALKGKDPEFEIQPFPSPEEGGDPKLVISFKWDDAMLDVREDLLTRLLNAIEASINAVTSAATGNVKAAIEAVADAVRSVFSEARLRVDTDFLYDVALEGEGGHTLVIEHSHRFQNQSSKTFADKPEKTNTEIFTQLTAGGKTKVFDLYHLRRARPGQTKIANVPYAVGTVTAFSKLQLSFKVGVEVYFAGFQNELNIEATIKRVEELASAAGDLVNDSFSAARTLVKKAAAQLGIDDEDDVDDLSKPDLLAKLKILVEKSIRTFIDAFKTAITRYIEQVRLDENIVTIHCITEDALPKYVKKGDPGAKDDKIIGDPGSLTPLPAPPIPVPVPEKGTGATKPSGGTQKDEKEEIETGPPNFDSQDPETPPSEPENGNSNGPGSFSIDPDIMLIPVARNFATGTFERPLRETVEIGRRAPRFALSDSRLELVDDLGDFVAVRRR